MIVPVTPFEQNCSLVWCTKTKRGAVIDPGGDVDRLADAIASEGVSLEKILVTHGHLDHAGASADLAQRFSVPIEGPGRDDSFWIDRIAEEGRKYGMLHCKPFVPDRWLEGGDRVSIGEQELEVYHCPGHTPGHVVFFHPALKLAFVGDVLFQGSIGRTDFPRGNHAELIQSITGTLWPLGDDVTFLPGHGPASTFGQERRHNPYVGDAALR
ncbi:MAG TPA: MBL fold metallo-hydrolase [Rhodospirillaceae bacterium]|nr:MBL fold metallo-hydrolase [Rhodospirillaceae bacterium]